MATVQEVLEAMKDRFDESAAARQTLTFQFDVTDDKRYYAAITDSALEIAEGACNDAQSFLNLFQMPVKLSTQLCEATGLIGFQGKPADAIRWDGLFIFLRVGIGVQSRFFSLYCIWDC